MSNIRVEVDATGVLARLETIAKRVGDSRDVIDAIEDVANDTLDEVKLNTPRSEDDGLEGGQGEPRQHIADMWALARQPGGKGFNYEVTVEHAYSAPDHENHVILATLETGSRSHIIRARNAKFLRFVMNGEVMFRKWVMHPGTQPYSMVRQSAVKARADLARKIPFITKRLIGGRQ